ncbi:VP39 [Tipula oleracea nudivirus]|uniref:VP39 n=1 Tax=Tipula oleracea nudivirus TaxID=1546257 RepID=A0A0B4VG04_9VIRU|nr:VP39 [Tipula oleracea nudivirus]AJD20147.1 VP39 [Tipula oleracea nudivirus]
MALQLASIKTLNFSTIGTAYPIEGVYEKNRRCLFEGENRSYNQKAVPCSNESKRYLGTLLICENHLRKYFKTVIQEFDIREVNDMQNSKFIKLVYSQAYRFTIPFPFELQTTVEEGVNVNRLCLNPNLIKKHDDRPSSFFQSIVAFATNGYIHTSGFDSLNELLTDAQQPYRNEYSNHYQAVANRWKNTYVLMKNTNDANEIRFTYIPGSELPYIYQTVLYYSEMAVHYVVPKNVFREQNVLDALNNTRLTRVLQPNMVLDLDASYFKMENFESPLKLYILEDGTNYATPIILAGFQVFEEGDYNPHNYQHSSVEVRKFSAFCL